MSADVWAQKLDSEKMNVVKIMSWSSSSRQGRRSKETRHAERMGGGGRSGYAHGAFRRPSGFRNHIEMRVFLWKDTTTSSWEAAATEMSYHSKEGLERALSGRYLWRKGAGLQLALKAYVLRYFAKIKCQREPLRKAYPRWDPYSSLKRNV